MVITLAGDLCVGECITRLNVSWSAFPDYIHAIMTLVGANDFCDARGWSGASFELWYGRSSATRGHAALAEY